MEERETRDIVANESVRLEITRNVPLPERKLYRVTAESGLFKRGQLFAPGEEIELDEATAASFKVLGEVEDV